MFHPCTSSLCGFPCCVNLSAGILTYRWWSLVLNTFNYQKYHTLSVFFQQWEEPISTCDVQNRSYTFLVCCAEQGDGRGTSVAFIGGSFKRGSSFRSCDCAQDGVGIMQGFASLVVWSSTGKIRT